MKIRRITDILHPAAKALAAAFLTVSAMALLTVGCTRPRGVPEEGTPDDPAISGLEYEVKFLLDPNQVLDGNHLLKPEWQTFFGITEEPLPIDVLYLETSKRDFQEEGWNNRLRWKSGKKKAECTYKKRYDVPNMDIRAAYEAALKDGFADIDPDSDYKVEIDWGYAEMKLGFSLEKSGKLKGHDSLATLSTEEAAEFLKSTMPAIEADWKEKDWGTAAIESARMAGPIRFTRSKGTYLNREVTLEIWPVRDRETRKDDYVVELSFKSEDFPDAAAGRAEITAALDREGILLHEDSLKTQRILDAWIPDEREEVPAQVHSPESVGAADPEQHP